MNAQGLGISRSIVGISSKVRGRLENKLLTSNLTKCVCLCANKYLKYGIYVRHNICYEVETL
jgi:hypothetical protein